MKFGDYLKNRDPQLAQSLTEGWFGGGITLDPQQKKAIYQTAKNEIDQLAQSKGVNARDVVDEFAQNLYKQYKPQIDKSMQDVASMQTGQKLPLSAAIVKFATEGGMKLANMRRDQGLRPPNDYRAAPNLGREGPVTPFRGMAQRHGGTLPGQ